MIRLDHPQSGNLPTPPRPHQGQSDRPSQDMPVRQSNSDPSPPGLPLTARPRVRAWSCTQRPLLPCASRWSSPFPAPQRFLGSQQTNHHPFPISCFCLKQKGGPAFCQVMSSHSNLRMSHQPHSPDSDEGRPVGWWSFSAGGCRAAHHSRWIPAWWVGRAGRDQGPTVN